MPDLKNLTIEEIGVASYKKEGQIEKNIQGWKEWLSKFETAMLAVDMNPTPLNKHNAMELLVQSQANYFGSAKILELKFNEK